MTHVHDGNKGLSGIVTNKLIVNNEVGVGVSTSFLFETCLGVGVFPPTFLLVKITYTLKS